MAFESFNITIPRAGTGSAKWDARKTLFGNEEVIPMWVADMDFKAPPEVILALEKSVKQGVYGYSVQSASMHQSIVDWNLSKHGWGMKSSWIIEAPGVVPSLALAVQALTEPGDQVLIQSPVYYPFYDVIKNNQRECILNPLVEINGTYSMDFNDLERKFKAGVKLMFLCSPHNPVGRVWTKSELQKLAQLCEDYNVYVISDEIHSDITFSKHPHIPFASLDEKVRERTVTCMAPSKTFNLAGLQASYMVIPNIALRKKLKNQLSRLGISNSNHFAIVATEAAYRTGHEWLEQLNHHFVQQFQLVKSYLSEHKQIQPLIPEGTYLIWLDCRNMGLDPTSLHQFMIHEAGVGLSDGTIFGPGGEGFQRMNIACSQEHLEKALSGIVKALNRL